MIDDDGIIYFGSSDGNLYAVYSESVGLADSPWPKYMHDNRNTGNVQTPLPVGEEKTAVPRKYALNPVYPNPFNYACYISAPGSVEIYDIRGSLVGVVHEPPAVWTPNEYLPSGIYLVRIIAGDFKETKRMVLVK